MTLSHDVARCQGAKSKAGQPLPPCIRCARRQPGAPAITPPVRREAGQWVCDKEIPQ